MQARSHAAASAAIHSAGDPGAAPARQRIAIVGAGFSGIAVAIALLRQSATAATPAELHVDLIDPRAQLGTGVAYATRDYPYPLNVAAAQMSLDATQPADFLDYVRGQGIQAAAGDYLPRQVFGEYLRARFAEARAGAPAHVRCIHRRACALQLRRATDGCWELWLDDGSALRADIVVLALGNPPPAELAPLAALAGSERYVRDPWSIGAAEHREIDSVLLVGSGLTMVDAALRLAAIRPRVRRIHVLSRHGWMPQPQSTQPSPTIKPDVAAALAAARGSIRAQVRAFRTLAQAVEAAGGDWREVFARARGRLAEAWQALDDTQRARFLRHARALWDVHRHRVPVGPLAAVRNLSRTGVLTVHAGRIEAVNLADDAVEVLWRPRGADRARAWLVDRVINCTGPESRADRHADPLVQSLLSSGLVRCDALCLGLEIAADGRPISRAGTPVDRLYYIGPWLRARDWEATAVPELREHARLLARRLAADLEAGIARAG